MTERRPHRSWHRSTGAVLLLAVVLVLSGCSGSKTPKPPSASAQGCAPLPGDQLVLLADDKKSQNSDNLVPVVRSDAAQPLVIEALDAVSRALSQDELQGLNRAVTVDGTSPTSAAEDFVTRLKIGAGLAGGHGPIVVGTAGFSESIVLGDVYAVVLRKAGYTPKVRNLTSRELLEPALEAGQVQVTPEYAASLTTFLAGRAHPAGSAVRPSNQIEQTISTLRPLAASRGLTVLTPAEATNQDAFAVTKSTADDLGVQTLSELATRCPGGVTFGGPPECPQRPFCQAALEKTYGLRITSFQPLDADGPSTRTTLKQGGVLLAEVFSSDADVVSAGG